MNQETIIGEWEFHIVDKNDIEKESNLKKDLIELWFLDYEKLTPKEKKEIDKLAEIKRNWAIYE